MFSFTGPGASSLTEFRGQELLDDRVVVLQPSSTYVSEDTTSAGTRRFFTTAATGSSTSLLGPAASGGTTGVSVQPDLIGSAIVRAGRYDVAVEDGDAHGGFFLRHGKRKPVAVTGPVFVGERTRRVTIGVGKWAFFSRPGAPAAFTVVS